MRLGYELFYSPSSPSASTSEVFARLRVYLGTRYAVSDSTNSFTVSGGYSASGSRSISHGSSSSWSSSNVTLLFEEVKTFSIYYDTRPVLSFSASMSGINAISGTAQVSGSITLPRRPYIAPNAPSNVGVVRSSDTGHTVTWDRNPTAAGPYSDQVVQRWDSAGNVYKTLATVSGTASSYSDRSTVANRRYRWRVRARNSAGTSSYEPSPYVSTTPAAPTGVTAAKTSAGDVLVSWTGSHIHALSGYHVGESTDGGQTWSFLGSVISGTSYTHTDPSNLLTHRYRVRAVAGLDNPTLESAWVESNTVQLLAPPAAPSNLSPANGAFDADEDRVFTWNHNPVDTTDQSAYGLQYRVDGGSWTYVSDATSESAHLLAAGTVPNGAVVEWQVRTWGTHGTASPWSAVAVVETSARPTATILAPTGTLNGSTFRVEWAFYDTEESVQTAHRVALYDDGGDRLEYVSRTGPAKSVLLGTRAQDGQAYTVGVQVRDGSGVWSLEAREAIQVEYLPPPVGQVSGRWDIDTGTVAIQVSHPEPAADEVPAVSCEVWRSANGADWVRIASGLPLATTVVDMIPATEGVNHYRVVTTSSLPSTVESPTVAVEVASRGWIYVNAGPAFSQMVKVRDNARTSYAPDRARSMHHFAGRMYPVEVAGQARTLKITADVRLGGGSSTWDEIEALLDQPAPFVFRDSTRREFVGAPQVSHSYERIFRDMSLSFEKVDHHEQ